MQTMVPTTNKGTQLMVPSQQIMVPTGPHIRVLRESTDTTYSVEFRDSIRVLSS